MLESSKTDYLDMERRWLLLARSYEFTERLSNFAATSFSGLLARSA